MANFWTYMHFTYTVCSQALKVANLQTYSGSLSEVVLANTNTNIYSLIDLKFIDLLVFNEKY